MTNLRAAAALILFAAAVAAADPPQPDPISAYEAHTRQGCTVMVSKRLADGAARLRCLDDRLAEVSRVLPAAHRDILRGVTFWVEAGALSEPSADGDDAPTFYVPLGGGLSGAHAHRREKNGGVVIIYRSYLTEPWASWRRDWCPGWLLHEVAHALEDRLAGRDWAAAKVAYRQAMDRKLYDEVRGDPQDGQAATWRGPAYARTSAAEYFAELSAAYLGLRTFYYPFTRDDLRQHDPAGYALMEQFWRSIPATVVNEFPFPMSVDRVAASGRRFRLCDLLPGKERAFDAWEGMTLVATDQLDGTEYRFAAADHGRWRLRPER